MNASTSICLAQDREIPIAVGQTELTSWRYAYARSDDARAADDVGQDYLAFRYDEHAFVFALCDGVSQSFYGDLAARILGDELLDWLWRDTPERLEADAIRAELAERLQTLTSSATSQVLDKTLPVDLPPMLRGVLEEKRARGSESTFACGRVDVPTSAFPSGRLVLAWMGDSRIRFWGPAGERTFELGDTFRTVERWSSRQGLVGGEPHVYVSSLNDDGSRLVTRLMSYSDGLAILDGHSGGLPAEAIEEMITRAGESTTSDDISFLELWLEMAVVTSDDFPTEAMVERGKAELGAAPAAQIDDGVAGETVLAALTSKEPVRPAAPTTPPTSTRSRPPLVVALAVGGGLLVLCLLVSVGAFGGSSRGPLGAVLGSTQTSAPTSTHTSTQTPTSTSTAIPSATRSATATYTQTPSVTRTPTPTRTGTPMGTSTGISTPTSTPTATRTPTIPGTVTTTPTRGPAGTLTGAATRR